jgi:hypothetical protein
LGNFFFFRGGRGEEVLLGLNISTLPSLLEQFTGVSLDVDKELCWANKGKGIELDSREDVANLLGAKDSVAKDRQVGSYVDSIGRPCSDLMLCPQEEPFVCEPLVCCTPEEFVNPECSGSLCHGPNFSHKLSHVMALDTAP